MPPADPRRDDIRGLVEQLRRGCRALRDAVSAVRHTPPADLPDAAGRHLESVAALRGRITPVVRELAARRAELANLPRAPCEELTSEIRRCRRTLQQVGRDYEALTGVVNDMLVGVERDLRGLQRGTRALGSYRRGARTAR